MTPFSSSRSAVAALAAGLVLSTSLIPAQAAPFPTAVRGVSDAVVNPVSNVQYRRYHHRHRGGGNVGAALAGGLILGALGAAAVASANQPRYDYYQPTYAQPAYGYGAPVVYEQRYHGRPVGYYDPGYDAWAAERAQRRAEKAYWREQRRRAAAAAYYNQAPVYGYQGHSYGRGGYGNYYANQYYYR
jgi:hypothetical protein